MLEKINSSEGDFITRQDQVVSLLQWLCHNIIWQMPVATFVIYVWMETLHGKKVMTKKLFALLPEQTGLMIIGWGNYINKITMKTSGQTWFSKVQRKLWLWVRKITCPPQWTRMWHTMYKVFWTIKFPIKNKWQSLGPWWINVDKCQHILFYNSGYIV